MLLVTRLVCAFALVINVALLVVAIPHNLTERQNSCCGYIITNRGNAYYRFKHVIDFAALDDVEEIEERGWIIADGWQSGGENPITGQVPIGRRENVAIRKGEGLAMKVPRQDKNARFLSVAEVQFPDATLGGVFQITAKLTAVPGVCMGYFTSHSDAGLDEQLGWFDETDLEMLSASLLKTQTSPYYQPAGIQMMNYRPSDGKKSPEGSDQPFPAGVDPSKGYHKYEIAWFPTTSDSNPSKITEIRFDGTLLTKAPKVYSGENPSTLVMSIWSNSDPRWSAGPPARDAIMYVKKVVAYYDKPARMQTGTGAMKGTCNKAMACKVTV